MRRKNIEIENEIGDRDLNLNIQIDLIDLIDLIEYINHLSEN